jgi:methyltransferase (TIGR00027 family)
MKAALRGAMQIVTLGAGYDTFPYRQPKWAERLRILEIDHPATQQAKRARFRAKGLADPDNLEFCPLDLEIEDFSRCLADRLPNREQLIWTSCLGVLAYLRRQTIHNIFLAVAALPRGSGITFTFAPHGAASNVASKGSPSASERAEQLGERWLTLFTIEDLEAELRACGFTVVNFFEPREAKSRYYENRKDLPVPSVTRLCSAMV